jgi:caffeoyl-CoA O-methyltransferase
MFAEINPAILARMKFLEEIDARDRLDGTQHLDRLRQIPPETGRFLALMAANTPAGAMIEIGTSAGYSTLWISLACELLGRTLTTFELLPDKAALARETFELAGVSAMIELVEEDARQHLAQSQQIAFCFLDSEKDIYEECYEIAAGRLAPGGLLIADNAVSHGDFLAPFLARALADDRVDSLVVPVGKGLLFCRGI